MACFGVTVTLTAANTNYSLHTLATAIDSTIPSMVRELSVQSDPDNGSAIVRIGDANLSDTRYGKKLNPGNELHLRAEANSIQMTNKYLRSDSAGALVNLHIEVQ